MTSVFKIGALVGALLMTEVAGAAEASNLSPMSVADFLGTVDMLRAKGPMALFSPDVGKLKHEGEFAMNAWHAQAAPAGAPRNACPPQGKIDLKDKEFLGFLQAVPPGQRSSTSVAQAVTVAMNQRYPCR